MLKLKSNSNWSARHTKFSTMTIRDTSTIPMACLHLIRAVGTVWVQGWTLKRCSSRCSVWIWEVVCLLALVEQGHRDLRKAMMNSIHIK